MFLAHLFFAAALFPTVLQDKPAPPPPAPVPDGTAPLKDVDGKDVVPGAIPESTPAAARALWKQVLKVGLPDNSQGAVKAFDLTIDVRYRASSSQSNDMPQARYQWLAPSFVRADTGRGVVRLRGPSGSYLIDSSKAQKVEVVKLDVDRTAGIDRKQLDEEAGIATNFARMTDPNSIRIRKLSEIAGPPEFLPGAVQARAKTLVWLELESPDFFVMRTGTTKAPLARVSIGVDVTVHRIALVVVDDAAVPRVIGPSTAVLSLSKYEATDGFQVPKNILVWLPESAASDEVPIKASWPKRETIDMVVLRASLRAALTPADFLPPTPTKRE